TQISFKNLGPTTQTTTSSLPVIGFTVTNLTIGPITNLPDDLGPSGQNYQMQAKITDPNGQSKTAFLSGTLMTPNGPGTITASGANITNLFTVPSATLDFAESNGSTDHYVITLNAYSPPGSGGQLSTQGALGATVAVTNTGGGGGGGNPHDTPE